MLQASTYQPAPQPIPNSPVQEQVSLLVNCMEGLRMQLMALTGRIEPVMVPAGPVAGVQNASGSKGALVAVQSSSPLVEQLSQIVETVQYLGREVEHAISRLEV